MIKFEELEAKSIEKGLIPVIIQDNKSLRVLMLGYMNRGAYEKSIAEGRVTFFSRSKERLWTKGETSGNYLYIKEIEKDCDNDTLLLRVDPAGPVCHTGSTSCFGGENSEGFIRELSQIIKTRHEEMPEGSYTTKLFNKGVNKIAQKVGEEAVESVIEATNGTRDGLIYELSDLVYHALVLMENNGVTVSDIEKELWSRHYLPKR